MTIEQTISILGQIATWVTVILVFFTLREMEKQRKASQKPELIIPNMPIWGYADNNEFFISSNWSNKELKNDKAEIKEFPHFIIYNIGAGAAKEINIAWDFDFSDNIKSIQDYCYHNSIPVVVSLQEDGLKAGINGNETFIYTKTFLNNTHSYLMPASVTSQGIKSSLPLAFLTLLSISIFLDIHQSQKKSNNKNVFSTEESLIKSPALSFTLSYVDIGGEKYTKKIRVAFQPSVIRFPLKDRELLNLAAFQGVLEFKEKK